MSYLVFFRVGYSYLTPFTDSIFFPPEQRRPKNSDFYLYENCTLVIVLILTASYFELIFLSNFGIHHVFGVIFNDHTLCFCICRDCGSRLSSLDS